MKKQYTVLTAFIIIASTLQALTPDVIINKFNVNYNIIFRQGNLFSKDTADVQKRNIPLWDNGIALAKDFVNNNSKNLLGMQDSDLKKAMQQIEHANDELINSIKVTRNITNTTNLQGLKNKFSIVENNMKSLADRISSKFFAINNKKEAQRLIVKIAIFIESAAKKAQEDIDNILI